MSSKRTERDELYNGPGTDDFPAVAEAVRAGSDAAAAARHATETKDDEKISLFWRVFGGTIISVTALTAVTLYNSLSSGISELRGEIAKLNEARAESVKKSELDAKSSTTWDRISALQNQNNLQNATLTSQRAELDALKERLTRAGTETDALKKDTTTSLDAVKKDLAAVEVLKDRLAALEGLKKEVAGLDSIREKLTAVMAEFKSFREDTARLRQDVDRNQASDQERKVGRDEQYKQFDRLIKDLQNGMKECQMKLARLEGVAEVKPMKRAEPAGASKDEE